jgi:hypothetical protein
LRALGTIMAQEGVPKGRIDKATNEYIRIVCDQSPEQYYGEK